MEPKVGQVLIHMALWMEASQRGLFSWLQGHYVGLTVVKMVGWAQRRVRLKRGFRAERITRENEIQRQKIT